MIVLDGAALSPCPTTSNANLPIVFGIVTKMKTRNFSNVTFFSDETRDAFKISSVEI